LQKFNSKFEIKLIDNQIAQMLDFFQRLNLIIHIFVHFFSGFFQVGKRFHV